MSSYRHIVLFKFKDSASREQVAAIENAFRALPSQISSVQAFEWGTDVSPEGLADGFTHSFLVTFADRAALDIYLPHPAHQSFIELLKPQLEKVLVVDYVAQA
jgi:quinol monooxygenase YgiN